MKKYLFVAMLMLGFVLNNCEAQQTITHTNTTWGESVHGVQMSIDTVTNVISAGSMIVVKAQIENTSTNLVTVKETASWKDFSVWLENSSGEKIVLTDNSKSIIEYRNFIKRIHPGDIDEWELRLMVGKDFKLGHYTMKATRKIKSNGGEFVVESNPCEIQIE